MPEELRSPTNAVPLATMTAASATAEVA